MVGPACAVICNLINTHKHGENYGIAAGTPEGRRHLVEPQVVAGPASGLSRSRTSDGRAAYGDGWHRAHGGPPGNEGIGSTR